MARRGLNRAQFTPNVQDSNDLKGGGFQVLEDEKATRLKAAGSQRRPREQQTINFRAVSNFGAVSNFRAASAVEFMATGLPCAHSSVVPGGYLAVAATGYSFVASGGYSFMVPNHSPLFMVPNHCPSFMVPNHFCQLSSRGVWRLPVANWPGDFFRRRRSRRSCAFQFSVFIRRDGSCGADREFWLR